MQIEPGALQAAQLNIFFPDIAIKYFQLFLYHYDAKIKKKKYQ